MHIIKSSKVETNKRKKPLRTFPNLILKYSKLEQSATKFSILRTLSKSKLLISKEVNAVQPLNIPTNPKTSGVLKLDKFNDFNDIQLVNIRFIN